MTRAVWPLAGLRCLKHLRQVGSKSGCPPCPVRAREGFCQSLAPLSHFPQDIMGSEAFWGAQVPGQELRRRFPSSGECTSGSPGEECQRTGLIPSGNSCGHQQSSGHGKKASSPSGSVLSILRAGKQGNQAWGLLSQLTLADPRLLTHFPASPAHASYIRSFIPSEPFPSLSLWAPFSLLASGAHSSFSPALCSPL